MNTNPTAEIARLNDLCQKAMGVAGRLVQTEGVCALLPLAVQSAIREKLERFDDTRPGESLGGFYRLDAIRL